VRYILFALYAPHAKDVLLNGHF